MGALCGKKDAVESEGGNTNANQAWIEKSQNRAVEKELIKDSEANSCKNRLLLLGPGDSGKSTIFKQAKLIYGQGFTKSELLAYTQAIQVGLIIGIKALLSACDSLAAKDPSFTLNPKLSFAKHRLTAMSNDSKVTAELTEDMQEIWADQAVKRAFEERAHFQISDSLKYFLDKVTTLTESFYVPSHEDILRLRARTSGIMEMEVDMSGDHITIIDVGGQRTERKKWIHCFDNVTSILFVAALSEYDQNLFEADDVNRVVEALQLFEETCQNQHLKGLPIILFLNKSDLFKEKLAKVPLTVLFPDYQGTSYEDACAYMKTQFATIGARYPREIYAHITCATDSYQIIALFESVRQVVVNRTIRQLELD